MLQFKIGSTLIYYNKVLQSSSLSEKKNIYICENKNSNIYYILKYCLQFDVVKL